MAKLNSSLGAQSVPGIGAPLATIPGVLGNPALLAVAQQQAGLLSSGLAAPLAAPPAVIPPPGIAIPQLRAPAQIQPVGKNGRLLSLNHNGFFIPRKKNMIATHCYSPRTAYHSSSPCCGHSDCCGSTGHPCSRCI